MLTEFDDLKFLATIRQFVQRKPSLAKLVIETVMDASTSSLKETEEVARKWESVAIAAMQLVKDTKLTPQNKGLANHLLEVSIADLKGRGALSWPEHTIAEQRDHAVAIHERTLSQLNRLYQDVDDTVKHSMRELFPDIGGSPDA